MMNTCAKNQGNLGGSCISGVSVLQKVTLKEVRLEGLKFLAGRLVVKIL